MAQKNVTLLFFMALISVTKQNSLKIFDIHLYSSLENHPPALFYIWVKKKEKNTLKSTKEKAV